MPEEYVYLGMLVEIARFPSPLGWKLMQERRKRRISCRAWLALCAR